MANVHPGLAPWAIILRPFGTESATYCPGARALGRPPAAGTRGCRYTLEMMDIPACVQARTLPVSRRKGILKF